MARQLTFLVDIRHFPAINACLNTLAGVCLLAGWRAVKKGKTILHRRWMIAALGASAAFLASYLFYHFQRSEPVRYEGEGILRLVYFFILGTHTPLAVLIIPCAASAVYFALRGDFPNHVRITRRLLPAWLYVSGTGILIYLMLYVF